jgi:hypothetical protein
MHALSGFPFRFIAGGLKALRLEIRGDDDGY